MLINDKVDAVYIPDSPSRIKATDYNQIKNEIQECITEAGLTPTKDVIQLPQALKILTAQSGAEEVAKIEAAGQEQLDAINTAGQTQTAAVNAAGESQKTLVENTGITQISEVQAAGERTVSLVEQAGVDAAQLAKDWAIKTDGPVASGEYSAKKYAQEAAQSASIINPSTYVPKAGGTMTGSLTLQDTELFRKTTSFAQGDVPEKDVYLGLQRWRDKDNKDLVVDYTYAKTTGNIHYTKRMWQNTAGSSTYRDIISLFYSPAGVSQVSFEKNTNVRVPTPQSSSNSTDAATTAWVRNLISGQSLVNDYVVDSYTDASGNWYRVYKSGWVEQGGYTNTGTAISFLKPFNTLFGIYAIPAVTTYNQDTVLTITSLTTTGFNSAGRNTGGSGSAFPFYWQACGQGA